MMKKLLLLSLVLSLFYACGSKKNTTRQTSTSKNTSVAVRTAPKNVDVKEKKPKKSKEDPYIDKHLKKLKNSSANLDPYAVLYIQEYADVAMDEMKVYKIPASITLAQGMLESGNGRSNLSKKSNNHFGIKCHSGWNGDKVYHDDDAKGECFRKYKYVHTSYKDHSLFLTQRSRYDFLFDYKMDDYRAWAKGLKKAGYATDRQYPNKLIALIERYQLQDFDAVVLKKKPKRYQSSDKESSPSKKTSPKPKKSKNGVHIVEQGETLYLISTLYGVSVEDIKNWNALSSNDLSIGQSLRVDGKSKKKQNNGPSSVKTQKGVHRVQKGETLYSISKMHGMTTDELRRLNGLKSNDLFIGQELKVNERRSKDKSTRTKTYKVKKGDTLYSISKRFKVEVDDLKSWNKLRNNELSIGQELIIKQ